MTKKQANIYSCHRHATPYYSVMAKKTIVASGPIEIKWLDPEKLIPYENNSKAHPAEQVEKIKNQIIESGAFDQPIVVTPDMVIVKGHGRRLAALDLKIKRVPVIIRKMTEAQAIAARLGDNKSAESSWDFAKLRIDFETLENLKINVSTATGFSPDEIKAIQMDWVSDIEKVKDEKGHTDGITSMIKVSCPQELRSAVKDFLITRIEEHGFEGVEVE